MGFGVFTSICTMLLCDLIIPVLMYFKTKNDKREILIMKLLSLMAFSFVFNNARKEYYYTLVRK